MTSYSGKILTTSFCTAIERVTDELKKEGFGILSNVIVQRILKRRQGYGT